MYCTNCGHRNPEGSNFCSSCGHPLGDKGGDANLGVWARGDGAYAWLRTYLTTDRLRELLPEAKDLTVDRHELPNLRAVNFVLHGLLGDGVAGSTRFDPQAKALGELLRARLADVPTLVIQASLMSLERHEGRLDHNRGAELL